MEEEGERVSVKEIPLQLPTHAVLRKATEGEHEQSAEEAGEEHESASIELGHEKRTQQCGEQVHIASAEIEQLRGAWRDATSVKDGHGVVEDLEEEGEDLEEIKSSSILHLPKSNPSAAVRPDRRKAV